MVALLVVSVLLTLVLVFNCPPPLTTAVCFVDFLLTNPWSRALVLLGLAVRSSVGLLEDVLGLLASLDSYSMEQEGKGMSVWEKEVDNADLLG